MLTPREAEVLKLVCEGYNNNEIANILFISSHTAKAHVIAILKKLNVKNRTRAAYLTGMNSLIEAVV